MKKLAMLMLVVAVAGFASVSVTKAQDTKAHKAEPKIIGKVIVVKDAAGAVTAVQLENRKLEKYNVVLDAKGKELGEKMVGKLVAVKAVESVKNEAKWLTVESYTELQKPKAKDSKPQK
ncbi:MAG TPA: hypothetical protein PLP05_11675 [Sedimentisphaerales bacterium]|nr:hypothetical protein [Sedimentisphaerales bacterium]